MSIVSDALIGNGILTRQMNSRSKGGGKETKKTPTSLMDEDQKGVERHETWLAEAVALPGQ